MNGTLIFLNLFMPVFIVLFGLYLYKSPPPVPNMFIGFRTRRSSASRESWIYANALSGKWMLTSGLILTALYLILYLIFLRDISLEAAKVFTNVFMFITLGIVILITIYTQIMVCKKFDRQGNRIRK